MECGDLSPLCAGDLSPSNAAERGPLAESRTLDAPSLADKSASTESGDKSPHSKVALPSPVFRSAAVGGTVYTWSFTNHFGGVIRVSGPIVEYTARKDEPFTIHIARTRVGETNTLTLRERANDLDRNGGNAFVRNLIP